MNLKPKLLWSFVFTSGLIIYSACRKTDQSPEQNTQQTKNSLIEERFFNSNRTADPNEKALVDFLRRKNNKERFVEKTVAKIGYPRWDKIITTASKSKIEGRVSSDSSLSTFYLPFVRDSQNYVNASMVIKTYPSDTSFSYKCDWQYTERQNNLNSYTDSAEYYAIFFMILDKAVFGHTQFTITDTSLFKHNSHKPMKIQLDSAQTIGRTSFMEPIEICQEVTVWYQNCPWNNTTCAGTGGTCDNCWQCTEYISWTYCWTEWIETGGGGGGTGGTGGSGGSGGTGGSGGGSTPPDCGGPTAPFTGRTYLVDPCTGGWEPIPIEDEPPSTSIAPEPDPSITNHDPDMAWWNDETTTFPPIPKPSWAQVNANFPKKSDGSEMCGEDVYNLVGGTVLAMMPPSRNACAVRVSRALNYSGVNIPNIPDHTFQGADGKYYFLSAAKLYNWMRKSFGQPDLSLNQSQGGTNGANFPSLLAGHKGIYLMQPNFPAQFQATGHATLYTGNSCIVHNCGPTANNGCYFNPPGGVYKINLWELQ